MDETELSLYLNLLSRLIFCARLLNVTMILSINAVSVGECKRKCMDSTSDLGGLAACDSLPPRVARGVANLQSRR